MKNEYSFKGDVYPLVRLVIPLTLTGMVQSAAWFFQTLFLAHVGGESLAAGSLVGWLFATLFVIVAGILCSVNILVSHKHGADDQHAIAVLAREGLWLATFLAILAILLLWNMAPIFLLFGQSEDVVLLVEPYLHALSFGVLADFITRAVLGVIIGVGRARITLAFSVIAVSLNVICSYAFIFGKFGFPAIGIAGAGWGMTASYIGTLIALIVFTINDVKLRKYFRLIFTLDSPVYLLEMIYLGLPLGLMHCVEVAFFFALTLSMGVLGLETQAANQVVLQYLNLMMAMIFSLSQAITIRVGHLLGVGQIDAVERASYLGVLMAVSFISVIAIIYWNYPFVLISVDFNVLNPTNHRIVSKVVDFLEICAIFQIVETARIALFGSLRGLKDTRFTLVTSIVSFWCIALPAGYLFAMQAKLGGIGYWWGMVIGASVGAVLLLLRFRLRIKCFHKMDLVA
tara:strand:+ start:852 stop:2222 length:1371 start_codon:yes stop_codon:yes gene_type:complete